MSTNDRKNYETALPLSRFDTASGIQTAITHLSLKRWTPQQRPYADALISLLRLEREALIKLGVEELKTHVRITEGSDCD
jgi:hypothetical protein